MDTITYKPTMEQIRPHLDSVVIDYDTRRHWGSHDARYVRDAMEVTGFDTIEVTSWEAGHKGEKDIKWDYPVDRFLMDDVEVSPSGVWISNECEEEDEYNQIHDYAEVKRKLDEIIRISYVLADENLLISAKAVNKLADSKFREMLNQTRFSQVKPNYCVVPLTAEQWENVCRMKSPQSFKGNAHRQYVHDPWISREFENVVVVDVKVWEWKGNNHWEVTGKCVFTGANTKTKDDISYPMDYWD